MALARDGTDRQKEQAAEALGLLAINADNQVAIAKAGGMPPQPPFERWTTSTM